MTSSNGAHIISVPTFGTPVVDSSSYLAPGSVIAGAVTLEPEVGIWFNAVLRADYEPIVIGAGSNIQDNVACHVDAGFPLVVGKNVSVGHNAVLHGCTIEDDVLVGMAAVVMNGAVIGSGSLIAAGALVLEGTIVPPGSLVAGVPAKVRRMLIESEIESIRHNAQNYRERLRIYKSEAEELGG
jgi:carbonic anhydrase/acetyltransferase-like protein (isoleucine patch superfamily)